VSAKSDLKIEQQSDDLGSVNHRPDQNQVALQWQFTAVNRDERAGNLTDPKFEGGRIFYGDRSEAVTPEDFEHGRVEMRFIHQNESRVEGLSNAKINIEHTILKHHDIVEILTKSDSLQFEYSVRVEDGVTPYRTSGIASVGTSGTTLR